MVDLSRLQALADLLEDLELELLVISFEIRNLRVTISGPLDEN